MVKGIIKSLRPHHWIKNLFLFAGVIFAERFFDVESLLLATAGFGVFCALASGVYLMNDLSDIRADRAHPEKRNRPIASGTVPVPVAAALSTILMAGGLTAAYLLGGLFFILAAGYVLLQVLYTFFLKHQPILDILAVAAGFVIRAAAGGAVIHVPISSWLLVCTSLLALFLVTEKRRQELSFVNISGEKSSRPSLKNYSVEFLDQLALVEIASTIVAYTFYVFSEDVQRRFGGYSLGFTIPFVFYGLFRYLWLVHREGKGESPTRIFLSDLPSLVNIALWAIVVFVVVYLT